MFFLYHIPYSVLWVSKAVEGVKKMRDGHNPATWMIEVTETSQEEMLHVDFHQIYKDSELYQ